MMNSDSCFPSNMVRSRQTLAISKSIRTAMLAKNLFAGVDEIILAESNDEESEEPS